ncbi:hypothetical protein ACIA8K_01665 [Catenuloplanes sp. NPDC051500]|uniref:hypothetical protein n=1 Tax=Catenuloplanes sp. NPDC051500 TaxID=3363959 RepID=UPI0037989563
MVLAPSAALSAAVGGALSARAARAAAGLARFVSVPFVVLPVRVPCSPAFRAVLPCAVMLGTASLPDAGADGAFDAAGAGEASDAADGRAGASDAANGAAGGAAGAGAAVVLDAFAPEALVLDAAFPTPAAVLVLPPVASAGSIAAAVRLAARVTGSAATVVLAGRFVPFAVAGFARPSIAFAVPPAAVTTAFTADPVVALVAGSVVVFVARPAAAFVVRPAVAFEADPVVALAADSVVAFEADSVVALVADPAVDFVAGPAVVFVADPVVACPVVVFVAGPVVAFVADSGVVFVAGPAVARPAVDFVADSAVAGFAAALPGVFATAPAAVALFLPLAGFPPGAEVTRATFFAAALTAAGVVFAVVFFAALRPAAPGFPEPLPPPAATSAPRPEPRSGPRFGEVTALAVTGVAGFAVVAAGARFVPLAAVAAAVAIHPDTLRPVVASSLVVTSSAAFARLAMAPPACKTGARRAAAHSRGSQEYGP